MTRPGKESRWFGLMLAIPVFHARRGSDLQMTNELPMWRNGCSHKVRKIIFHIILEYKPYNAPYSEMCVVQIIRTATSRSDTLMHKV